ncbi:ankyrin repeat and LEM domain-containing protein 1 [Dermacentor silvarum]|uniref:ankyrin repeat and LEM domain-containing protein 1 n=1 Tax=Dermacentor silvarum TaxID=543639 RepID=UPI0021010858|nr:ankyrin repeat and LEM domain-containing protein 1 [Dermacentor silvarum]
MSPPRPGAGDGCILLRSDIVFKALQRKDSVLFDKLVRHGSLSGFVLPDSDDGMTLLHLVVSVDEFSVEFLDKLLDSGADPNAANADGVTALHIAAASGNADALERLVERGGDPSRRDPTGKDVLEVLVESEHWDCLGRVRQLLGLTVEDREDPETATPVNGSRHPTQDSNTSIISEVAGADDDADVSPRLSTPSDVSSETESLLNTAYVFPHPYLSPVYVDDKRARPRRRQRGTDVAGSAADGCEHSHTDESAWPSTSESSFDGASRSYDDAAPTDSSWASSNLSQELLRLSDEELREQLAACCGYDVGPVLDSNRNVHRHALAHYRLGARARVKLASTDSSYGSATNGNKAAALLQTCDFCEVVHKDPETGFVLKEEHYHSSSEADSSATTGVSSSGPENETVDVPPELQCLTNEQILAKLRSLGDTPGPVTDGTRLVYLNRLARLHLGLVTLHKSRDILSPDVHTLVLNAGNLDAYRDLEVAMMSDFDTPRPNSYWREGNTKGSFTYLLLDTRVTRNLPLRAPGLTLAERMSDFLKAVFYVGKGKRSRPFSHLCEALLVRKGLDKSLRKKEAEKTRKILQIWDSRHGVVSLHVFQNTLAVEAYTREACMIDAIGLRRLTNQKKGDVYGVVQSWNEKKRRKLGAYLVYKALNIFLSEGERHLGPLDL